MDSDHLTTVDAVAAAYALGSIFFHGAQSLQALIGFCEIMQKSEDIIMRLLTSKGVVISK